MQSVNGATCSLSCSLAHDFCDGRILYSFNWCDRSNRSYHETSRMNYACFYKRALMHPRLLVSGLIIISVPFDLNSAICGPLCSSRLGYV